MALMAKYETRANGKIIIIDFAKLDSKNFKHIEYVTKKNLQAQVILFSLDGRLFINRKAEGYDYLVNVFEILMQEDVETLKEFQKVYGEKYKGITFENVPTFEATEKERNEAFAVLCIPTELNRRKIEQKYYGNN